MNTLQTVVLVAAIAALVKGAWMILWPGGAQSTVDWWLQMPGIASRILGALSVVLGLFIIGLAVSRMGDAVLAAATILGTVFVTFGMLYQWPPFLQAVARPFSSSGRTWVVRAGGVLAALVALILLVIALTGGDGA